MKKLKEPLFFFILSPDATMVLGRTRNAFSFWISRFDSWSGREKNVRFSLRLKEDYLLFNKKEKCFLHNHKYISKTNFILG